MTSTATALAHDPEHPATRLDGAHAPVPDPGAAVPTLPSIRDFPVRLLRELRTDHAGETGAVMIYRGVLAIARDPALRDFARHHLETEQRHLDLVEGVVPPRWRSRLLPLWRVSGWLTGALPALLGPRAVYATIQSVETFVDRHYAEQVVLIDALLRDADPRSETGSAADAEPARSLRSLRALLEQCRLDEVAHRDDAGARWDGHGGLVMMLWQRVVGRGSEGAVAVCRYL